MSANITITKALLCVGAARAAGMPERVVVGAVDAFLGELARALAAGRRVELRGLGSFRPVQWAARQVKPPRGPHQRVKPGGVRAVKSAFSVRFRAGAALRRIR